jgi:hypothetical protein
MKRDWLSAVIVVVLLGAACIGWGMVVTRAIGG